MILSLLFFFLTLILSLLSDEDEEAGEIPVAFVVRKSGSTLSCTHVMEYVAKQVRTRRSYTTQHSPYFLAWEHYKIIITASAQSAFLLARVSNSSKNGSLQALCPPVQINMADIS